MSLLYLDYNCFQRGFDDPGQVRIQLEALACQELFVRAGNDVVTLIWSFMHDDETHLCPFPERKIEALRLASLCKVRIGPVNDMYHLARSLQQNGNLSAKDAIHVACAVQGQADCFLTCDDRLARQAGQLNLAVPIMNPVDYIRKGGP